MAAIRRAKPLVRGDRHRVERAQDFVCSPPDPVPLLICLEATDVVIPEVQLFAVLVEKPPDGGDAGGGGGALVETEQRYEIAPKVARFLHDHVNLVDGREDILELGTLEKVLEP